MKKRYKRILLLLGFIINMPMAAHAADYTLKIGTLLPEGTVAMKIAHDFEHSVEARTQDKVNIIFYAGAVLGDEIDMIRKIKFGQLHGGAFTGMGLDRIVPAMAVWEIPFLFENFEEVDYVREKVAPLFAKLFDEKGYYLLEWGEQGFIYFFSKEELKSFDGIKNLRSWLWAEHIMSEEIINSLDVNNRVPLRLPEVLPSLQTGIINSFYVTPFLAIGLQWHTQAEHMLDLPLCYSPGAFIIIKQHWEKIPEDLRAIIREEANIHFPKLITISRKDHTAAMDALTAAGIQFDVPPPEMVQEIKERTKLVRERMVGNQIPVEIMNEIIRTRDEFRAKK